MQFKDAVLTLKVTPQITDAGTVILTLEVENNTPDFAQPGERHPADQHAGGQDDRPREGRPDGGRGRHLPEPGVVNENKTPLLGNIPLLGYLFRQKGTQNANNELLLFITPRIVKS